MKPILLGVNIDHIATVRQARRIHYPDMVHAALLAEEGGADGITVHLREDRRHIQDEDVFRLQQAIGSRLNFEMAATDEMVQIARELKPAYCCLVPEKREELTTEGGLNVLIQESELKTKVELLQQAGIKVSLFIDPDMLQIEAAKRVGAELIELHTGAYAESRLMQTELLRLEKAAEYADQLGLVVNAGHGLHYHNTQAIARIVQLHELNIGHSIVARALFVGLREAVKEMKHLMQMARLGV